MSTFVKQDNIDMLLLEEPTHDINVAATKAQAWIKNFMEEVDAFVAEGKLDEFAGLKINSRLDALMRTYDRYKRLDSKKYYGY